jgi:hypothetical protein
MTREERIISELAYRVERSLETGETRPQALRDADDYLHERGWFVPRRGATRKV